MKMRKVLIGTTNPGKIVSAKAILKKLGYAGLSFADLRLTLTEPEETLELPEEIATEKAVGYARQFRDMPILARDDTNILVGVADEDDPKNHNKEFVARRAGEYSDENGARVFSEIAHKYGGEIPLEFHWGYSLAWWEGESIECVSGLAINSQTKLVEQICPRVTPGFCFAPVVKVPIGNIWKYDSELSEEENWKAYWNIQMATIKGLLDKCSFWKAGAGVSGDG